MSANKPQEIPQKPVVDEKEEKGSKNPVQSGEVKPDTPKPSTERTP